MAPTTILIVILTILMILVPAVSTYRCNYCGHGTHCKGRECVCWKGFGNLQRAGANGLFTCQDRNECREGAHHCKNGTMCVNRVGSYDCECYWGWHGPWVTTSGDYICTEKSLCETRYHRCGTGTQCVSSNTSDYTCICAIGFRSLEISRQNEFYTCKDIDECSPTSKKVCGDNSLCTNTPGSFRCKCLVGYQSRWKDDTDCVIQVSEGQSDAKELNSEQTALVVGGALLLFILCIVLCCIIFRRYRSRKQPIKLKYHQNNRPLTISVSTDRQSNYVNVTLTSDEKCASCSADDSQTRVKVEANGPELKNDRRTEEPGCETRIQQETTLSAITEDVDDTYANRDTIKRIKRLSSRVQTKPEITKIPRNSRYSNDDKNLSWHSENASLSEVPLIPEDHSYSDITNEGAKKYDHLRRGGDASPVPEPAVTEHTYSLPEGAEDEISDTECDMSRYSLYQPVLYGEVTGNRPAQSHLTKHSEEDSACYEPVIYSIPDKSKKRERIYMNDPR